MKIWFGALKNILLNVLLCYVYIAYIKAPLYVSDILLFAWTGDHAKIKLSKKWIELLVKF